MSKDTRLAKLLAEFRESQTARELRHQALRRQIVLLRQKAEREKREQK